MKNVISSVSLRLIRPLFLAFALLSAAVSAEASLSMDVGAALELTLKNNPALLSLRRETDKALAFKLQAEGTRRPELSFNAYVDYQKESQTSDGSSRYDNRTARVTLSHTLYSGGRNEALGRQIDQVTEIAERNITDAENRAAGELLSRFYNVLLQERRAETVRSGIATSEMHLREVSRMSELGLSNRLEVIRASQQLAANRADLSSAEGDLDNAVISLMNHMAIPPEDRQPITGSLEVIDTGGGREESLNAAMTNRADRAALERQIEYQGNQIDIENSASKPRVTLGASAGILDPYRSGNTADDTWRAELSITIPIFDRDEARSGVIRARAVMEQDRIALSRKDLDIKSEVESSWREIETARERLESSALALELAEESLRLAGVGFQEGVTPQLDLLQAQTSLTESRLEHLSALYSQMQAVFALKTAEGNIIEWAERMNLR
ncbi:MAG: TolC family protein [Synergistaceae bacterium]|nr:TolC family protein [Synergistaceae bacterium]